jgi:TolB-like protein/tetratricopeptide (TPR) repeat protein
MTANPDNQRMGGSDVFVSYASQDVAVADTIVEALERHGVKCWIAPRDVVPGEFYAHAIVGAINATRIVLVVLTGNAVGSPHVLREIERASAKRHPVVSFRIDTASLPAGLEYFLSASHWLDATTSGVDAALPKLVEAVQRLVAPTSAVEPAHQAATAAPVAGLFPQPPVAAKPKQRLSRAVIALSAVLALGLAYFAVDKLWTLKHAAGERPVAAVTPETSPAAPAISDKSVAVLPFLDMSEKKDQEYFSDGLSEELIDLLTKVPDLRVPARTSSFFFKGKAEDIATIAKKLRVAHVLEGSVRKAGNTIRVTAQLIRADNGYHLWSETYDRELKDVFKVQDDIAGAVVTALKLKLAPAQRVPTSHRSESVEAYRQYLLGKQLFEHPNKDNLGRAAAAYRQALLLDPGFAAAHAGLAVTEFDLGGESRAAAQQALLEAEKAVALAQGLAEAYSTRGFLRFASWDWTGSEADFDRANELDPNDSVGLRRYGELLGALGRLPESIAVEKKAVDLDPLAAWTWQHLSRFQIAAGLLADARESAQHALEINPDSPLARDQLGVATLLAGDGLEATRAFGAHKVPARRLWGMALAEHALGHRRESQQALDQLITESRQDSAFEIAEVYAWRGEKDQAFAWLDKAYVQQRIDICFIKANAFLKGLEADPRFRSLLRKMKLPE